MSGTVTIRDVPEEVRDQLALAARERGQSLQAFLLSLLARQVDFYRNPRMLVEIEEDLELHGGAGADAPDAADLINAARAGRDATVEPGGADAGRAK